MPQRALRALGNNVSTYNNNYNMEKVLKEIANNKYKGPPPPQKQKFIFAPKQPKNDDDKKKKWYKIGKIIVLGHRPSLHNESKLAAKRTYLYYHINKGNWVGPSPRQLGKMRQSEFQEYFEIGRAHV